MSEPNQPENPPMVQLMRCITGHWVAAAVYTAAKLSLADQLAGGPKSSEELARKTNADAPSVYRLLRALTGLGIFKEIQPERFVLTEVGELLRSDHPQSMRLMALFQGAPPHWQGWGSF